MTAFFFTERYKLGKGIWKDKRKQRMQGDLEQVRARRVWGPICRQEYPQVAHPAWTILHFPTRQR